MTEDEFAAYQTLGEETEDHRWAFGTGFTDPLEGIDPSVPDGVDAAALAAYCLMLGDDALIYSHRLQQWMTRLPELEEETALANIALDLLGQARMLLARAGQAEGAASGGTGRNEDQLAFFRDEHEFRNVRLAEHADADFAELTGPPPGLLGLAAGAVRPAGRPRPTRCSRPSRPRASRNSPTTGTTPPQWVIRLGDGTPLSHGRMQAALDVIWPLTGELFQPDPVAARLPGVAADPADLRGEVDAVLDTVLAAATLDRPQAAPLARVGGPGRARRRAHRGVRLPARRAAERGPRPPGRHMVTRAGPELAAARAVAAAVPDPELPMVTVADLGILRDVAEDDGRLVVTITPTYSGCPALREIAHDLRRRLAAAGFAEVTVRTALAPPWSSDWITAEGRRKLPRPASPRRTRPRGTRGRSR